MRKLEPEWYEKLKEDPFIQRTFTDEHILNIEKRARTMQAVGPLEPRYRVFIMSSIAAVLIALVVGIGWYQGSDPFEGNDIPINQSGDAELDVDWYMSEEELQGYEMYQKHKSDDLLKGLEPLVLFRYYVHASLAGDNETSYALLMKDEEYETLDLETYLAELQSDLSHIENTRKQWERLKHYQIEQVIDGSSAYIVMTDDMDKPENQQHFGLTKNREGIWKVNWMAMQ